MIKRAKNSMTINGVAFECIDTECRMTHPVYQYETSEQAVNAGWVIFTEWKTNELINTVCPYCASLVEDHIKGLNYLTLNTRDFNLASAVIKETTHSSEFLDRFLCKAIRFLIWLLWIPPKLLKKYMKDRLANNRRTVIESREDK